MKPEKVIEYAILSPIVVDPRWTDIPENLKFKAFMYRLLEAPECVETEMATEFDALVYLHTASLSVPFGRVWFNIYAYLFRKFFPKHAEKIGLPEIQLNQLEQEELKKLRKWIFKQQIKAIKEKKRDQSNK